jgi:hypothetical protein
LLLLITIVFAVNSKDLLITRNGDDPKRRRSWTALGDLNINTEKRKSSDRRRRYNLLNKKNCSFFQ